MTKKKQPTLQDFFENIFDKMFKDFKEVKKK
jgi:hypothetical protein